MNGRKAAMVTLALAFWVGLTAPPARAHPHEFYGGGADFLVEGDQLARLRIVWVYNGFTSLFVLSDLGISPVQPLDDDSRARLVASQTGWPADWDGDSFLYDGAGNRLALSGPKNATATIEKNQIVLIFERIVLSPAPLSAGPYELRIYDPSFYAQHSVTKHPRIEGTDACRVEYIPFRLTDEGRDLADALARLGREDVPDDPNVGANFAEKLILRCA